MIDRDEAAISAGKAVGRSRERAREAGRPRRREKDRAPQEGGQRVPEGLRKQECIGVVSVCRVRARVRKATGRVRGVQRPTFW